MCNSGEWVRGCLAGSNVGLGLTGPRWNGFGKPGIIIPGGKNGGMPCGSNRPGGTPWGPAAALRIKPAKGELAKLSDAAAREVGGGELIEAGVWRLFSCFISSFSTSRADLESSASGSVGGMPSPLRRDARLELAAEVGNGIGEEAGNGEGGAREAGLLSERPGEVWRFR